MDGSGGDGTDGTDGTEGVHLDGTDGTEGVHLDYWESCPVVMGGVGDAYHLQGEGHTTSTAGNIEGA